MTRDDRNLLLRCARRLEERAHANYNQATTSSALSPAGREQAKRTRDAELGDVLDIKEFVAREKPIIEHEGTYVMAPAEPDAEMVAAGDQAARAIVAPPGENGDWTHLASAVYRAMVKGTKPL